MSYPKRAILIAILLAAFLFVYIRHVKTERDQSVDLYFGSPQIGDIYKIQFRNIQGRTRVRYFKIVDVNPETLFLYQGKITSNAISDILLDSYETDHQLSFSRTDMEKIKKGSFSNGEMYNANILAIERR